MYKRVMIKLSGEALAQKEDSGYNREFIEKVAKEILELNQKGVQVTVVTGAGNYWRGARSDKRVDRVSSDIMGMLATTMNAIYISDCFNSVGVKSLVMSSVSIGNIYEIFSKHRALELLEDGKVLVFAFGIGHPFFSTDTAAALYGSQIEADILVSLKFGVDGVYTKNPMEFGEEAEFIENISYDEIISNNEIKVMDNAAACICKESNLKTVVLDYQVGNIIKVVSGEKIGTLCSN